MFCNMFGGFFLGTLHALLNNFAQIQQAKVSTLLKQILIIINSN